MPYVPPKSSSTASTCTPQPSKPTAPPSSSSTTTASATTGSSLKEDLDSDNAMLTPRPTNTQVPATSSDLPLPSSSIDNLSTQLASTQIVEMDNQNAYTSVDSTINNTELNSSASNASLMSMATTGSSELKSVPSESEIGTPPTSHGTPEIEVADDRVTRYREGLYAYTRGLYLEAKLSQKRKNGQATYSQFGLKQSGMEKMAAKKALARRLND